MEWSLARGYEMAEYNKLTKRLLAEGYSAESYPKNVRLGGGCLPGNDPLRNIYGGFVYTRQYADERIYETECGMLVKGREAFDMTWMEEWCHENDNPIIHCPMRCTECNKRPEQFREQRNDALCPVHPAKREYRREGSVEEADEKYMAWQREKKEQYLREHPRACKNHLRWDIEKQEWRFQYLPRNCMTFGCVGHECPVLGRTIGNEKGNIYYDIESEYPDRSKDGTFFEGERIRQIIKDNQFFDKPENLQHCENYLKAQREEFNYLVKINKLPKLFGAWTIFNAELGRIDFRWKITNVRVVKKLTRDIDEDLRAIEDGTIVRNAKDEEKEEKERKKKQREEAKVKRIESARKLIVKKGLKDMEEHERARCIKILGREEVIKAQHEHDAEEERKRQAPVQMSIFDLMEVGT